ncbi:hypothetical protein DFH06DRAFT_439673 [Mycena polygramma]|nr:hypothetical protein DFH06DRAFT_439673 [Mycena polygramma]
MPSLPSAPPSPPALLPSPLVGLAVFLGFFILITGIYAVHSFVVCKLAERRPRIADVEASSATVTVTELKGRSKGSPQHPTKVLAAARARLVADQTNVAAKAHVVSLHRALMTEGTELVKPTPPKKALMSGPRRFLQLQGELYAPGHIGGFTKRSLPGPSPLRNVHTAAAAPPAFTKVESAPAPVDASAITVRQPVSAAAADALAARPVCTSVESASALVDASIGTAHESPSSPAATVVCTASAPAPSTAKGPAALILAALARDDPGADSDPDPVYLADDSFVELDFVFDAAREMWTTVVPLAPTVSAVAPSSAECPPPPTPTVQSPARIQPQVFVDSRLRNLRYVAKLKEHTASPSKRGSMGKNERAVDKENDGTLIKQPRSSLIR